VPVVSVADAEADREEQKQGAVSIVDSSYDLLRRLEMQDEEPLPAAPTGLGLLDKIIGGYFCANLAIAGGRPGMGKSILGELAARAGANAGFAVDYFDLENQASTLTARLLCDIDYDRAAREGRAPIHYSRIHLRRLSRDERGWLAEALTQLHDMDLQIHDRDELTMSHVAALCRAKAARTSKRMLVIIDHMHLIEPSNRYAGRKVDEVAEVTKGAKRLAKRLNASVLLLAQLNRDLERREDKRPNMADFRESGSIEQDADVMIGINRPHYHLSRQRLPADASDNDRAHLDVLLQQTQNVMEIGVLKNRHGETGDVTVFVDVASSALRDVQPTAQTEMSFERLQARAYGEPMF